MSADTFEINNIRSAVNHAFHKGLYLVLLNAHRVPPHLGLVSNGLSYSLTFRGPEEVSVESLLRVIHNRKIPSLFIALDDLKSKRKIENQNIKETFFNYHHVEAGEVTCLFPIKEACSKIFQKDFSQAGKVYELIENLSGQHLVSDVCEFYLESFLTGSSFSIKRYTVEDIYKSFPENVK